MTKLSGAKNSLLEIEPTSRKDWRLWLQKNRGRKESVWVILYKKTSGKMNLSYVDLVEEALCFGWVDSKPNKIDALKYKLLVSPRKPMSGWSALNKKRVQKLIATKQMTKDGLARIQLAKQNGAWTKLESSDRLEVPKDLSSGLKANKKAETFFETMAPSSKKAILEWINAAKTDQTRTKRIKETVALAAKGRRANNYRDLKKMK